MHRLLTATAFLMFLGTVFVHSQAPEPGEREWRFIAGGPIVGWCAADAVGRFYFTAEDRFLYALDGRGVMRWRTDLRRRPAGMVCVGPDGSIYVVLDDGRLLAINKDGRLLWEFSLEPGKVLPPVVLSSGTVVISDKTGSVIALTHTGFRIWVLELGEALSSAPIVSADGLVLFGTVRGNVVSVDPTGRVVGTRYVGDVPSVIAQRTSGLLVGTTSGRVIRLGPDTQPLWRTDLGSAVAELVLDATDGAYARLDDGSVAHVMPDGIVTWRANPTPGGVTSIAAADGVLLAIRSGSAAHIAPDGSLSWQLPLAGRPILVSLSGRQTLLVSAANWVTYAFPFDADVAGPWPMVRGRPAATGVPPGVVTGRPDPGRFRDSFDYIYLAEFLHSPFESDQLTGLAEISSRIPSAATGGSHRTGTGGGDSGLSQDGAGFAGSYPYVLSLCEEIAGAPYFGPVGYDGRINASRGARDEAIRILGIIGDLQSTRYLLRLLRAEQLPDVQVEILASLTRLRTGLSGDAIQTLVQVVESYSGRAGGDQVALAAITYLQALYDYEGGFLSADGVQLLTGMMTGSFGREVRDAARAALAALAEGR